MKGLIKTLVKKAVVDLCSKDRELKHHRHYPLSRYHLYSLLDLFFFFEDLRTFFWF